MLSHSLLLGSLGDSLQFGQALAAILPTESICLFEGNLAAGKTTIIRAIAGALGANPDLVTSPTYTIANCYQSPSADIYHVDLYRLTSSQDLYEMDQDDWLNPSGPTFIEWPMIALPFLTHIPYMTIQLHIPDDAPTQRLLTMSVNNAFYEDVFSWFKTYDGALADD